MAWRCKVFWRVSSLAWLPQVYDSGLGDPVGAKLAREGALRFRPFMSSGIVPESMHQRLAGNNPDTFP